MLKKLSFIDLIAAVQKLVKDNAGIDVADAVPRSIKPPYAFIEAIGQEPVKSKTMYKDRYDFVIHCFEQGSESSVPVFEKIKAIQEALTVAIEVPEGYNVLDQSEAGLQRIQDEADGIKHAILSFSIQITSGFKMKI
ncbi:DUF5072 domain-containing protein [Listeria monocytogenes]|nr:DUF5072 domain-containing protein [Listeria monocytogenes]